MCGVVVLQGMAFARVSFACCAWLTCATPVVNVIAEPPAGSLEASRSVSKLEAALGDLVGFTQDVREGQRRVSARAQDVLEAQSSAIASLKSFGSAASLFEVGGARSDAARFASLLADVAGSVGVSSAEPLAEPGFEIPDAEVQVRKLLMDAGKKFADASGSGAARGASTATSFLQPVDANHLRGSLHVTEPMRTSPPMAVNVIMAEDVRGMQRDAAQRGVAEQVAELKEAFEADLIALQAS